MHAISVSDDDASPIRDAFFIWGPSTVVVSRYWNLQLRYNTVRKYWYLTPQGKNDRTPGGGKFQIFLFKTNITRILHSVLRTTASKFIYFWTRWDCVERCVSESEYSCIDPAKKGHWRVLKPFTAFSIGMWRCLDSFDVYMCCTLLFEIEICVDFDDCSNIFLKQLWGKRTITTLITGGFFARFREVYIPSTRNDNLCAATLRRLPYMLRDPGALRGPSSGLI